jgi:tetratricopeptide (TPR) repeat protein
MDIVSAILAIILLCGLSRANAESDAEICWLSHDDERVIRACSIAIEAEAATAPKSVLAKAYTKRGVAFGGMASRAWGRGDMDSKYAYDAKAIADYDKAIALDPTNWVAYNNRAYQRRQQGHDVDALPDVEKAFELSRSDPSLTTFDRAQLLELRGAIYAKLGQKEKAIADFRAALRLDPRSEEAVTALRALGAGR